MMFRTSALDPRKLSQPWFQIARQSPGRREAIHGRIHALDCKCRKCTGEAR